MLLTLENVLNRDQIADAHRLIARSTWASGLATAGPQAASVKDNQQLPESAEALPELRRMVLSALNQQPLFFSAALPVKILPPFFNRYAGNGSRYGPHTDGAMRLTPDGAGYVRADVSATLFLSQPDSYDGGVLSIEDTYATHDIKLNAGSMVIYPSSSIHQVTPVTRGERVACFMFMQSMVRDAGQRRLLFDMDCSLQQLRQQFGEVAPLVQMTGVYHNLLRRWAAS